METGRETNGSLWSGRSAAGRCVSTCFISGVFAVTKDSTRDRLICDRRPQNSQEGSVGRVLFPFCPRLRRLILHRSCALGVHIVDTPNCFYLYEVDPARWHTQVVGPRIPASWLHGVFDESLDSLPADSLDAWWESDLRNTPGGPEASDDYRQLAITENYDGRYERRHRPGTRA